MKQFECLLNLDLSLPRLLRPCSGQGASLDEEIVLADPGWAGDVAARVGRVRGPAILNSLRVLLEPVVTSSRPVLFRSQNSFSIHCWVFETRNSGRMPVVS